MKKGFTLVEIIVTIVILSLIIIIVAPNILDSKEKTKMKMCEVKKETIERSVIMYVQNHRSDFINGDKMMTIKDAADSGIIDFDNNTSGEVINPYNNENMYNNNSNYVEITITNTGNIRANLNINCGNESD